MRRFISFGPALVVLLTIAVVLVAVPAAVRRIASAHTSARIVLAQRTLDDDDILERINAATRAVADSVRPSLVHIEVFSDARRRFGARSTGSGWVFDSDGHIVTNAHVVRGAERISVQFPDGRIVSTERIRGEVFLADPYTDIAVFKIPADSGVFPIRRATGVQPRQGETVFAFGSPFGFKFSMSQGIISGLGRDPTSAVEFGGFTNFIQTDAAVNPGNSGGPLVDTKGRVIGMSVAIATGRNSDGAIGDDGGDSAGISFAIPLGTIESVVAQLLKHGEVSRGLLGIRFDDRPARIIDENGYHGAGVRVVTVTDDGPAAKAGVRPGDIIVAVDGEFTGESNLLRSIVSARRPGEEVKLRVWQSGAFREVPVTLVARPKEDLLVGAAVSTMFRMGLRVETSGRGAVVNDVQEGSRASSMGFEPGQRITMVAGKPVKDAEEFFLALGEAGLLLGRRIPVVVSVASGDTTESKTIQLQVLR
ncbi:MAG: trypsin-like peptidase domain-containing protein [Phycisphaeraceae bacterium]|nr:trypsin-like peptidase domain-containing protein [Phycisphaeraceae bacterium]